ncbi:hypothetical protein [Actinacidiphila sp. ITFR-21]|uniref:hypothetical protein n=1 Tax=Actinacidiphila sp. ITFR-21 TaxID=3075199 RepID=UPI00288AD289|nr:hypothetical protein [Streptomyces sp. ITFR-21]WNI19399.1 hypothetical protein RLT57_30210 [Streptomyces sp. ITFR-21]
MGGVVVQQSTEDADPEVWNLVHSDPGSRPLLESGRPGFALKTGQGAKPGLGGMTVVGAAEAARLAGRSAVRDVLGDGDTDTDGTGGGTGFRLRSASHGTFTEEIVRQQPRFLRNDFPRVRTWVKFHPGRDVAEAAAARPAPHGRTARHRSADHHPDHRAARHRTPGPPGPPHPPTSANPSPHPCEAAMRHPLFPTPARPAPGRFPA